MATSGSFSKTISNAFTLKTEWTAVQDVATNKSTITATHKLVLSYSLYVGAKTLSCTIGGVKKTFTAPAINSSGGTTKTLGTTTHVLTHNSDGSISASGTTSYEIKATLSGTYYTSVTATGALSITSIPRASTITSVTSSVAMTGGNACTVNISRKSTAFHHSVKFSLGSYSYTATNVATSTSYTIPSSWCNALPNATSGRATVTVTTYNASGTKIGSSVSSSFTVTVPASSNIDFSLTVTRVNGTVPSDWGVYVQGKSKATVSVSNIAISYGSQIKTIAISGGGYSGSSTSSTGYTLNTGYLNTANTNTFTATVTDGRGQTKTKTISINVEPYTKPTFNVNSIYAKRCNADGTLNPKSGAYAKVYVDYAYSSCDGENTATATVEIDSDEEPISDAVAKIVGGDLDVTQSYNVSFTITDEFSTTTVQLPLSSGTRSINISADGKTVAVGGMAQGLENGGLEVYGDTVLNNSLKIGSFKPIEIEEDTDMNTLIEPNFYRCWSSSVASSLANCPVTVAFGLEVIRTNGVCQRLTTYEKLNPRVFIRSYYPLETTQWGEWQQLHTTRTIQSGYVDVSATAESVVSVNVEFDTPFVTEPIVILTPIVSSPIREYASVAPWGLTTGQFTLRLYSDYTETVRVNWVAMAT